MILPRANNGMQLVYSIVSFSIALFDYNVILMHAKTLKQFFSNIRKPPIAIIACAISQEVCKLLTSNFKCVFCVTFSWR